MNFLKWKREILFLIPSITGGGTSSLLFTQSNQRNKELTWKTNKVIQNFLQSIGINEEDNFQSSNLLKEASNYSNIIPILTRALSIQIAKQIFNGKLYKGTAYENTIGKIYPKLLSTQKQNAEHQIKTLQKNKKRIKQKWAHDEKKYLESLKDYVLSRIDEKNIQEYFTSDLNDYLFKGKNIQYTSSRLPNNKANSIDSLSPLLGFLMGVWIENHKPGYYVHQIVPYANTFSSETKNFYEKKYKGVKLPDKPDYFFPDFDKNSKDNKGNLFKEYIDEWLKGTKTYLNWYDLWSSDRSSDIKNITKIEWISSKNNTHKNIALRYLTEKGGEQKTGKSQNGDKKYLVSLYNAFSSIFLKHKKEHNCDSVANAESSQAPQHQTSSNTNSMPSFSKFHGNLTHNPLNLFCINDSGQNQPDFMLFTPDATSYKTEDLISSKIIFYRDEKGFNLLYPINKKIIDDAAKQEQNQQKPGEIENLVKSSELVNEFKKYIENNFSWLLLKYHSFIRKKDSKNGKKVDLEHCACDEMIKQLIELIELGQKLKDWNSIWKFYDVRKSNNSVLTASTAVKNSYLNKMGTADINPPDFLQSRIKKDLPKLSELQKSIQDYATKASKYLGEITTMSADSQSRTDTTFQFEKISNKGNNYWVIKKENASSKAKDESCMKKEILQYLLESIFTQQLINKYLKIPLIFESSHDLFKNSKNNTNRSKRSTTSNNSWDEKLLTAEWRNYLKTNKNTTKISEILLSKIKESNILSKITNISDTTLHYLMKKNSSNNTSSPNELNKWDNIESFITLTNLDDPNNQLSEQLKIFITSVYLMENSFEEYKENIRKIIKDEGFGVYAFTLSWNKICPVEDSLLDPIQKVELDSFWTPIDNKNKEKEWDKNVVDPKQCIQTSDRLSISSIKKKFSQANTAKVLLNFFISIIETVVAKDRNIKEEEMMGFKGLISSQDINKLPEEFYFKIFSFLYKEGHINWQDIKQQISNLKTNHQLNEYIKKINNIAPEIGKTFELSDIRQKPETVDQAKSVDPMDWFDLNKRKELLIKFIEENILPNQPEQKQRFQGLLFEQEKNTLKHSYVFDKNGNSSIAYLIQITIDDLKDNDSFFKFVQNHLTPESLIQDVVKQAQNKSLQMKAINNFLARGQWIDGKRVYDLRSGDYFLKNQFSSIVTV